MFVLSRLSKGIITTLSEFQRDMLLIFDNCRLFNVQARRAACHSPPHQGQGEYVDIANAVEKAYRAKLVRWLKGRR